MRKIFSKLVYDVELSMNNQRFKRNKRTKTEQMLYRAGSDSNFLSFVRSIGSKE